MWEFISFTDLLILLPFFFLKQVKNSNSWYQTPVVLFLLITLISIKHTQMLGYYRIGLFPSCCLMSYCIQRPFYTIYGQSVLIAMIHTDPSKAYWFYLSFKIRVNITGLTYLMMHQRNSYLWAIIMLPKILTETFQGDLDIFKTRTNR